MFQRFHTVAFFQRYGLDLRSLALLRMTTGGLIVWDCLLRLLYLRAHYSDLGVLPRDVILRSAPNTFSLFLVDGGVFWSGLLLSLLALGGATLAYGYRTRWMTFLTWLLLVSVQARNPLLLNGGDTLLRLLLFWGFFLPWGQVWSRDARELTVAKNPEVSWAGAAYLGQIITVYVYAGVLKHAGPWSDGSAIYYALKLDHFVTPFGLWMLQFPKLLELATVGVFYLEVFAWVFLLCPIWNGPIRTLGIALLACLHGAIALHMSLGLFTLVAIFSLLGLLPTWFWEKLESRWTVLKLPDLGEAREPGPKGSLKSWEAPFVIFCFLAVTVWNVHTLPQIRTAPPAFIVQFCQSLRLDQRWSLFAPYPMTHDGWFVVKAELRNGKSVSLWGPDGEPGGLKPESVAREYPNARWRELLGNLYRAELSYREAFLNYLVQDWDREHRGEWQIDSATFFHVLELTPPPGEPTPPWVVEELAKMSSP